MGEFTHIAFPSSDFLEKSIIYRKSGPLLRVDTVVPLNSLPNSRKSLFFDPAFHDATFVFGNPAKKVEFCCREPSYLAAPHKNFIPLFL